MCTQIYINYYGFHNTYYFGNLRTFIFFNPVIQNLAENNNETRTIFKIINIKYVICRKICNKYFGHTNNY